MAEHEPSFGPFFLFAQSRVSSHTRNGTRFRARNDGKTSSMPFIFLFFLLHALTHSDGFKSLGLTQENRCKPQLQSNLSPRFSATCRTVCVFELWRRCTTMLRYLHIAQALQHHSPCLSCSSKSLAVICKFYSSNSIRQ